MKIGIIGTGQIGRTLVKQYTLAGHQVKMTNASGPDKLKDLQMETGARAASAIDVVNDVKVLVLAIPLIEVPHLAKMLANIPEETVIIDTTNYYPIRDGVIREIEDGMPESVWVSQQISRPVVKAYNSILAGSLVQSGKPKDSSNRIALPVSGDNEYQKQIVMHLINNSGFDAMDIGDIGNSRRQQPGSTIYCTDLNLAQLKINIDQVDFVRLGERRELALQFILRQNPLLWLDWWKECITNNRIVFETNLNY